MRMLSGSALFVSTKSVFRERNAIFFDLWPNFYHHADFLGSFILNNIFLIEDIILLSSKFHSIIKKMEKLKHFE